MSHDHFLHSLDYIDIFHIIHIPYLIILLTKSTLLLSVSFNTKTSPQGRALFDNLDLLYF